MDRPLGPCHKDDYILLFSSLFLSSAFSQLDRTMEQHSTSFPNDAGRVRLFLVDDSRAVLDAIKKWLTLSGAVEVVGMALSAADAVEQVAALKPDVVLLDVRMPGKTGLDAVDELKARQPEVRIVLMSHYPIDDAILDRKSTRLNSSHVSESRMPSSA